MLSFETLPAAPKAASGIYRIFNEVTGKSYVGSAINLNERFYNHVWHLERGSHRGPKLVAAWQKHGRKAFSIAVLEIVSDKDRLIEREQYWIEYFNAAIDGYNTIQPPRPISERRLVKACGARCQKQPSAA